MLYFPFSETTPVNETGNVTGLDTVAARRAQSGASDKTQHSADKVAKEAPELAVKVAQILT